MIRQYSAHINKGTLRVATSSPASGSMKYLAGHCVIATLALLFGCAHAGHVYTAEADPELTLQAGDRKIVFKRSDLLKRSDIEAVSIANDVAYPGRTMTYKAVRTAARSAAASSENARCARPYQ
jgi:hypothetical protein